MKVKELMALLAKCNPEAFVDIEKDSGDYWAELHEVVESTEPIRLNTMPGWGPDVVYSGIVTLTQGDEMVHCEIEEEYEEPRHRYDYVCTRCGSQISSRDPMLKVCDICKDHPTSLNLGGINRVFPTN